MANMKMQLLAAWSEDGACLPAACWNTTVNFVHNPAVYAACGIHVLLPMTEFWSWWPAVFLWFRHKNLS